MRINPDRGKVRLPAHFDLVCLSLVVQKMLDRLNSQIKERSSTFAIRSDRSNGEATKGKRPFATFGVPRRF